MMGAPGTCEVSDAWIEDIIDDALCEYSGDCAVCDVVPVSVVAGQAIYTYPAGYFAVDSTYLVEDGADVHGYRLTGYESQHNPVSIYGTNGQLQNMRDFRRHLHGIEETEQLLPGTVYSDKGGMLEIYPPPTDTTTQYVPLLRLFDLTTIPAHRFRLFSLLAASIACRERAAFLSKTSSVKTAGGTRVTFHSPEWLLEQSTQYLQQYRSRSGAMSVAGGAA